MLFANSNLWWTLLSIPMAVGIVWCGVLRKDRLASQFADQTLLSKLAFSWSSRRSTAARSALLSLLVTLLLALALLRPQWGFSWTDTTSKGVDIVIAVDVSQSMLAKDVPPSRLERTRRKLIDLLTHLKGDRVALVAFSGTAFIEAPLTLDYAAFRLFVSSLDPDLIPIQGTNIQAALDKAIRAFHIEETEQTPIQQQQQRNRAIILVSDGENFDGDIDQAIRLAKKYNIPVFTLGVGLALGAPIPLKGEYKKDNEGNVIISRFNPELLKQIASETGGLYIPSSSGNHDLEALYSNGILATLDKQDIKQGRLRRWNEYFQVPVFLAIALLLLGPWGLLGRNLYTKRSASINIVMLFFLAAITAITPFDLMGHSFAEAQVIDTAESVAAKAGGAYERGDFQDALQRFQIAADKSPDDPRLHLGLGASLYRLNDFEKAAAMFFKASANAKEANLRAEALYNAGNSLTQLGEYREAVKAYEQSLKENPHDREALENLEYVKKLLREQPKEPDTDSEEEDDKKQPSDSKSKQSSSSSSSRNSSSAISSSSNGLSQSSTSSSSRASADAGTGESASSEHEFNFSGMDSDAFLDSVEENRNALIEFRRQKAQRRQHKPTKDW